MSCGSTYERYNEDEYFLIFLRIHPYLSYHHEKSNVSSKKYEIQCKLLNEISENIISKDDAKKIYEEISLKCQANRQKLADVECFHRRCMEMEITKAKTKYNEKLCEFMDAYL